METNCPNYKFLYHYTSIDALEKILKNKTIRFTRLDKVKGDPQEALSKEYPNASTFVFTSCWTDVSSENLPLWIIYTNLHGVRIKMPRCMFKGRHDNHKRTTNECHYRFNIDGEAYKIDALHYQEDGTTNYQSLSSHFIYGPTHIKYVDVNSLSINNINFNSPIKYDFLSLGTIKASCWQFENEVRFRLFAIVEDSLNDPYLEELLSPESLSRLVVETEYVDVALDSSVFDELEILLAPEITNEERSRVEDICRQYAPKAKITPSSIKTTFNLKR